MPLPKQLERYGIIGVVLDWVKSLKQAAVQMDDYISTCLYITVGVPQGSVVNDKCTVSRKVKCILFAESTNAGKICRKYVAASSNVLMTDNINVEYMKNHFQV